MFISALNTTSIVLDTVFYLPPPPRPSTSTDIYVANPSTTDVDLSGIYVANPSTTDVDLSGIYVANPSTTDVDWYVCG